MVEQKTEFQIYMKHKKWFDNHQFNPRSCKRLDRYNEMKGFVWFRKDECISKKRIRSFFKNKCYCGFLNNPKWDSLNPPSLCIYCKVCSDLLESLEGVVPLSSDKKKKVK